MRVNVVTGEGRSGELKRFLRAMRARLDPHALGLETPGRRRRARGLRIDEAAALANVGLTWYTALEAGKDIRVSAKLLDRVAAALRLSSEEREYLFALAKPREAREPVAADVATLRPVIDGFTVGPGFICDRFWNVYAANDASDRVYGHAQTTERNLLARVLFEPAFRALHEDWEAVARRMVGIMHAAFGRTPDDPAGVAVIERLRARPARTSRHGGTTLGLRIMNRRPASSCIHNSAASRCSSPPSSRLRWPGATTISSSCCNHRSTPTRANACARNRQARPSAAQNLRFRHSRTEQACVRACLFLAAPARAL